MGDNLPKAVSCRALELDTRHAHPLPTCRTASRELHISVAMVGRYLKATLISVVDLVLRLGVPQRDTPALTTGRTRFAAVVSDA